MQTGRYTGTIAANTKHGSPYDKSNDHGPEQPSPPWIAVDIMPEDI